MVDFNPYTNVVESICRTRDLRNFKNNPNYNYVVEHVSHYEGNQYLNFIRSMMDITTHEIKQFCDKNDSLGSPNKSDFGFMTASPTSLRYIFHSHLILKHLQSLNLPSADIVEIGGGYGGLCMAVHFFAHKYNIKINSYTCVDLPIISELQKLYLTELLPGVKIDFVDSTTYGANISNTNMFLISNYCFSEISFDYQKKYIEHLFPKVSHGFMAWNCISLYNFGFNYKDEKEYPMTHEMNRYVYF